MFNILKGVPVHKKEDPFPSSVSQLTFQSLDFIAIIKYSKYVKDECIGYVHLLS